METAYCIAFYDTHTLVIKRIGVFNREIQPYSNTNTKLLFEIQGKKYSDAHIIANKMLKQIAECAEITEVTENYMQNNNINKKVHVYIAAFYNEKTKDIIKVGVYNKSFIEAHSENTLDDNILIFTMYKIKSDNYNTAISVANQRLKEIINCIKQKFEHPNEQDECIII